MNFAYKSLTKQNKSTEFLLLNSIFSTIYCRPRTDGSAATEIATMLKNTMRYKNKKNKKNIKHHGNDVAQGIVSLQ